MAKKKKKEALLFEELEHCLCGKPAAWLITEGAALPSPQCLGTRELASEAPGLAGPSWGPLLPPPGLCPELPLPLPPCPLDSLCPFLLSKWSLSSHPFERKLTLTLLKISNPVQALQRGCGVMERLPPRRNAREKECGLLRSCCCSWLHLGGHAASEAQLQVCQASQATCCFSYCVWTSQLHNPPQLFLALLLMPHLCLGRAQTTALERRPSPRSGP